MKALETPIPDCFILEPTIFSDDRGSFFESYNKERFENSIGRKVDFVQDNQSKSKKGVLRGLHFQKGHHAQAKLIRVLQGKVLDVIVDMRKESPTFGKHFKMRLTGRGNQMLFIPRGIAHGFLSLTDEVIFTYKCDNYYHPKAESGILYRDPELNIDWEFPEEELLLSPKDLLLPSFKTATL